MYINSIGYYVPSQRIDNAYFKEINGLTPEWIEQRTGILTRSKASPDENADTMGLEAVADAVEKLPYDIKDVDLIIAASYSVYDTVATVAHKAQRKYDIVGAKAFYLSAACSSFINGMETAKAYLESGMAHKVLIICSEHNTYYANETDPKSGHLWGDGAVAYFVSADKIADTDIKVLDVFSEGLGNVGKGPYGVCLRPKEDGITMPDGRDVFIHACRYMIYSLSHSLTKLGIAEKDLAKIICHQANRRIVAQVAHQLDLPMERFLNNIETHGNTGSASAPLVLAENLSSFSKGDKVALIVFGGGYSCGSVLVEF